MNITINTGAALDDAAQIDSIVATIQSAMETLDGAIKITKLQLAGKNIVTGKEFMNGSFKKFNSDIFE